jgi:hypothetical protein
MLDELCGSEESASYLVASGFWTVVDDGWQFVEWAPEQPLREVVLAERKKKAEKMRDWRSRNVPSSPASNAATGFATDDVGRPDSDEPVALAPTQALPSPTPRKDIAEIRPDVSRLCSALADAIEANGSKRPVIGKTWLDSARMLIDSDHRPVDESIALIGWCQADPFWKANVLSMPKFREKYDTLRLQRGSRVSVPPAPAGSPRRVVSGRSQVDLTKVSPKDEWMYNR